MNISDIIYDSAESSRLVGTANLTGCKESVAASLNYNETLLPGISTTVGEILRVVDSQFEFGYFASHSEDVSLRGVGFLSSISSEYTFQFRWNETVLNISDSQIEVVDGELVLIRDTNFSTFSGITSCLDRLSCASETLMARVNFRDSPFESVGDFARVANSATEQGIKPLDDQSVTVFGVGFGTSTPVVDQITVSLSCVDALVGTVGGCLVNETIDSSHTYCGSNACNATPNAGIFASPSVSLQENDTLVMTGVDLAQCYDIGSSTYILAQIWSQDDSLPSGQVRRAESACALVASMYSIQDTSTSQGLAALSSQNVTILGTGTLASLY